LIAETPGPVIWTGSFNTDDGILSDGALKDIQPFFQRLLYLVLPQSTMTPKHAVEKQPGIHLFSIANTVFTSYTLPTEFGYFFTVNCSSV